MTNLTCLFRGKGGVALPVSSSSATPGTGSGDFEFPFCGECEEKGESVPPIRSLTSLLTSSRSEGTGDLEAGTWVWGCEDVMCEGVYQPSFSSRG